MFPFICGKWLPAAFYNDPVQIQNMCRPIGREELLSQSSQALEENLVLSG